MTQHSGSLSRWGKTWRYSGPAAIPVHQLEHHSIDVLAALDVLLELDPELLGKLTDLLAMPPIQAKAR